MLFRSPQDTPPPQTKRWLCFSEGLREDRTYTQVLRMTLEFKFISHTQNAVLYVCLDNQNQTVEVTGYIDVRREHIEGGCSDFNRKALPEITEWKLELDESKVIQLILDSPELVHRGVFQGGMHGNSGRLWDATVPQDHPRLNYVQEAVFRAMNEVDEDADGAFAQCHDFEKVYDGCSDDDQ